MQYFFPLFFASNNLGHALSTYKNVKIVKWHKWEINYKLKVLFAHMVNVWHMD